MHRKSQCPVVYAFEGFVYSAVACGARSRPKKYTSPSDPVSIRVRPFPRATHGLDPSGRTSREGDSLLTLARVGPSGLTVFGVTSTILAEARHDRVPTTSLTDRFAGTGPSRMQGRDRFKQQVSTLRGRGVCPLSAVCSGGRRVAAAVLLVWRHSCLHGGRVFGGDA